MACLKVDGLKRLTLTTSGQNQTEESATFPAISALWVKRNGSHVLDSIH
jgi:hypothetical protein